MKITDFFPSEKSVTNKGKERPVSTPAIDNTQQQEENMFRRMIPTPRTRKERFSEIENNKLVDIVIAHLQQLFGPEALDPSGKAAIWNKVAKDVNKVGGMRRTAGECKKRWHDYKRKVKRMIDNRKSQSSVNGQMLPLSKQQMKVAQHFKMDEIHNESSSDIGECISSNEPVLTSSYTVDSEEEFHPSQNKSFSSMTLLPSTSHQDKFISQSYEEPQTTSPPYDTSIPPYTATKFQLLVVAQMDRLAAQQKNIFQMLQSIQKDVRASQNIQNKIYSLEKIRLESSQAKLSKMNSIFPVKPPQKTVSTNRSKLGSSSTKDIRPTPTATYTPAATRTPKGTPARKRAVDQSRSSTGSMKKMKLI